MSLQKQLIMQKFQPFVFGLEQRIRPEAGDGVSRGVQRDGAG